MYFDTGAVKASKRKTFTKKANSQNALILNYFKDHKDQAFRPSEVHEALFGDAVPLTSTRRGITTMTQLGRLRKLSTQADSKFGRPENYWQFHDEDRGN